MSDFNDRGVGDWASTVLTRRRLLAAGAVATATMMLPAFRARGDSPATTQPAAGQRYKIGACDWIMLKRQTPGAITKAKQCGCDGVETDMGSLSKNPTFDCKFLKDQKFADDYLKSCHDNNIEISSIAMSGFYAQSFPERETDQPLKDCIATMKLLNVKVAFLPLGVYGDLLKYPDRRPVIVEKLKRAGEWAAAEGKIIGVETSLPAADECKFLDDIASPGIKSYFNFENVVENNRDLAAEIKTLGKDRICQIHPTGKDGEWLKDDPAIDMKKAKATLDEIGWSGWLVIERSRHKDHSRDVVLNFTTNTTYLKSIFQAG